jgi:hypothetical protein
VNITLTPERIGALAQTMGVSAADLATIISRGASHSYKAGDYLYHKSAPRLWMGIARRVKSKLFAACMAVPCGSPR